MAAGSAKYEIPFPYLQGLDVTTARLLEENFRYVLDLIAHAPTTATVFDAIIDPALSVSVPATHLYKNLTDLVANEVPAGIITGAAFNIGLVPRGSSFHATEPGSVVFPVSWTFGINMVAIAGVGGDTANSTVPEFWWDMPAVTVRGSIILRGVHVPSQSVAQKLQGGAAGGFPTILVDCYFGSGNIITDGDLFAYNSTLNVQNRITSGATNSVELWNCYWNGTVTTTVWANTYVFGGYINGGLVTGGTGACYANAQIQGGVQIGNTGGAFVNNLGRVSNPGGFEVLSTSVPALQVRGNWSQLILRGAGHEAEVKITQDTTPTNPAVKFVSATHCKVATGINSTVTGAQAYSFDAASHNNLLTLGGSHAANYTVASTDAGYYNRVITELSDTLLPLSAGAWQQRAEPPIEIEDVQDLIDQQWPVIPQGPAGPVGATGATGAPGAPPQPILSDADLEAWQQEHSEWSPPPSVQPAVVAGQQIGFCFSNGNHSYNLTATPDTAVDTTNATVSFVVPASGNVLVEVVMDIVAQTASLTTVLEIEMSLVLHGTSTRKGNGCRLYQFNTGAGGLSADLFEQSIAALVYITGLTPNTTVQLDLAGDYVDAGAAPSVAQFVSNTGASGNASPIIMRVMAA